MNTFKTFALLLAGVAAVSSMSASAFAETPWRQHHPRRVEVNARLALQRQRIDAGVRDGRISRREAHVLRVQDRRIRSEERFDAHLDNSHITRAEKRSLNQNETQVSREIRADKR
jgi:hypothetical protein